MHPAPGYHHGDGDQGDAWRAEAIGSSLFGERRTAAGSYTESARDGHDAVGGTVLADTPGRLVVVRGRHARPDVWPRRAPYGE
jgi:hypothetical protein